LALVVWPAVGALWVVGALQVEVPDAMVAAVILGVCLELGSDSDSSCPERRLYC
jgi:hypothetical protein